MGIYSTKRIVSSFSSKLFFFTFLRFLIPTLRHDIIDRDNRIRIVQRHQLLNKYDYIVIGGGSAGCVLASRLSENRNSTVLLLEAGGEETVLSEVPLIFPTLQLTNLDWKFKTEKSGDYCQGMKSGMCNWPRGKVLGGSSVLNAMLYVRGNRRDYDAWERAGNPGWGYRDVLRYFKKSEDIKIDELRRSFFHGTGGYLSVEKFRQVLNKYSLKFCRKREKKNYTLEYINFINQQTLSNYYTKQILILYKLMHVKCGLYAKENIKILLEKKIVNLRFFNVTV